MTDTIDLDAFRASVLAPWAEECSPACAAAAEALWLCTVKHARTRVTVLVQTPDATSQRLVLRYLEDIFKDQPRLQALRPRFMQDQVMIGLVRLVVTVRGGSRRPRGVVATVEMRGGAVVSSELPTDYDLGVAIAHCLARCVVAGHASDADLALLKAVSPDGDGAIYLDHLRMIEAAARDARMRAIMDDWDQQPGLHGGSSLEQFVALSPTKTKITTQRPPTRQEEIVSEAFERARAANMGKSEMGNGHQRRAITSRNRDDD
jgi:hypothetical protein